jgi:hypothetical protein
MTRKKLPHPHLPLTVPLQIPTWWTPKQAFAVLEMLDDLRDTIWRCYELQLLTEYRKQLKQAVADCTEQDPGDLPF